MATAGEESTSISNRQVVLRDDQVTGYLKESDMCMSTSTITLKLPQGQGTNSIALLVKNLYLSVDPYIRGHTMGIQGGYADQ